MKQKKKNSLNSLLSTLHAAENALEEHKNFNLAEAWMQEYVTSIPQKMVDQKNTSGIYHALQRRDSALLLAAIQTEKERLMTEKVKWLRDAIKRR